MTTPNTPSAQPTPSILLLQEIRDEMQGMNNRFEMLINMFQGLADQVEGHSAAIAQYFSLAAEAAEHAAERAAAASNTITNTINSAANGKVTQIVAATSISHGVDTATGKHTVSVKCGEWQKFGVPVYPEYWKRLGFEDINAIPMGTTAWEKDVIVQMAENQAGQAIPKRVIGLAQ